MQEHRRRTVPVKRFAMMNDAGRNSAINSAIRELNIAGKTGSVREMEFLVVAGGPADRRERPIRILRN